MTSNWNMIKNKFIKGNVVTKLKYLRTSNKYFTEKNFMTNNRAKIYDDKVGLTITIGNHPGALFEVLQILKSKNIGLSHIHSKPALSHSKSKNEKTVDIFLDLEKNGNESEIMSALMSIENKATRIKLSHVKNIKWFPKVLNDLNYLGNELIKGGEILASDHPGFNDEKYKIRRTEIEHHSRSFKFGDVNRCPPVAYTKEENDLWSYMFEQLVPLFREHACDEINSSIDQLISAKIFTKNQIPQIQDLNDYFGENTKIFFRPTGGLLSAREFLNSLAFRVFPASQYIRHPAKPLYTPEPDLIHEFLGHAAAFANNDFVDFSQEIGLASLGASDEEIRRLAAIYWYTVEFGLCKQNGKIKVYGGGLLSSPSELSNSLSGKSRLREFELNVMAVLPYDLCNINTDYFVAPSFSEMKQKVKEFAENINRPFNVSYDFDTGTIDIDRKLEILN